MYSLELNKIVKEIEDNKAKRVLFQLPDGLKPKAEEIVNEIEQKTEAEILLWLGDCYGGCDIPLGLTNLGIDLLVQFGHNKFIKEKW